MRAWALLSLVAAAGGAATPSAPAVTAARIQLGLRGGGLAEDQAAREQRLAASLARLRGCTSELQGVVDRELEDEDVMGYTSWGAPLSNTPTNAVVYNPDEFSDASEPEQRQFEEQRQRLAPTAESIASAMDKVQWIRNVVDKLAPAEVIAGLEQMGTSLEELQPVMNSAGTEMGNLTQITLCRERMKAKIAKIQATKEMLEQEMKKSSPVDELNEEIAGMRERGEMNPYIKLLHDWQKQHEHERESGALQRQKQALKDAKVPVGPVRTDPQPSAPVAVGTWDNTEERAEAPRE